MLLRVGGPKLHLKPEVEVALTEAADELLGQALSFGCSMARQRQKNGGSAEEQLLQPADVAAFLEHSWSVLPGPCPLVIETCIGRPSVVQGLPFNHA